MNIVVAMEMVGLAVFGLLVGWWLGSRSAQAGVERWREEREILLADRTRFEAQAGLLGQQAEEQKSELEKLRSQCAALTTEIARAQEQLKTGQAALASERELLSQAREKLTDAFKSLAGDILKENNAQFLGLANRELSAKEESIEKLLSPVRDTLDKLDKQTQQLEVKREGAYRDVLAQVENIQKTHEGLRQETSQLVQALRAPKARGIWGEEQLKRCIEFAGMVEHCSYDTEVFMRTGEDVAQRPDAVIHLPNGRAIIIDAKTPLDAYLNAMNATTEEPERTRLLQAHAMQVRTHLKQLSSKQYWQTFENSPDFVVCFLPIESLFSAALEQDPNLIEFGSRGDVILATPTTLIALLKAIAYGWQQTEITRNAMAIRDIAAALYDKLAKAQDHFVKLGKALASSITHYNNLVGTVEGRGGIFTQSRKLHELGVGAEEMPEVKDIEAPIRQLQSDDWESQSTFNGIALAANAAAEEESEGQSGG